MGLMAREDEEHGGNLWVCDVRDEVLSLDMRCECWGEVRMRGAVQESSDLHMTDGWPHRESS